MSARSAGSAKNRLPRPNWLGVAAVSAGVILVPSAYADEKPPERDVATAEALFSEGRDLMRDGSIDAACPKFEESYRLDPGLGTLLNAAICHEKQGRTATAWAEFRDVEQQASSGGDAKRAAYAGKRANVLKPRLPLMHIDVESPTDGLKVTRDGRPVGEAAFGLKVPVDPGQHVIRAQAPGYRVWTETIMAEAGGLTEVRIPALVRLPKFSEPEEEEPLVDQPDSNDGEPQRTLGFVAGGLGIVSLGVAGVSAIIVAGKKSTLDEECGPDGVCRTSEGQAAFNQADTFATIGTITFVAGALLTVGGVVLILTAPSGDAPPEQVSVRLRLGAIGAADGQGARLDLRF